MYEALNDNGKMELVRIVDDGVIPVGTRQAAAMLNAAEWLADMLERLMDYQNGTPLHKYEREWNEAMAGGTAALLAYLEARAHA